MRRFGLIGYPLSHSFSAGYFTKKFADLKILNAVYENFAIENIGQLQDLLNTHTDLTGLNVTIPYKEQIIPYLDDIDIVATKVKAVNTIKFIRQEDGRLLLKGYNTDIYGFETSLRPLLKSYHKKALILGTGGASKAIKFILHKLGINFISASIEELKDNEISYENIDGAMIEDRQLIINATPLGTYPKVDTCPAIPYKYITPKHVLFDLVYNPEETLFLKKGRESGAKTMNGLQMLHLQAEKSWEIWNDQNFS
jgi:shikimate dehydrogenase